MQTSLWVQKTSVVAWCWGVVLIESHTGVRTLWGVMDTFIILIMVIVSLVYAGQNDKIMHFQSVHFLKCKLRLCKQDPLSLTTVWVQRVCSSNIMSISLPLCSAGQEFKPLWLTSESSEAFSLAKSAWQGVCEGAALPMWPGATEKLDVHARGPSLWRGGPLRTWVCVWAPGFCMRAEEGGTGLYLLPVSQAHLHHTW